MHNVRTLLCCVVLWLGTGQLSLIRDHSGHGLSQLAEPIPRMVPENLSNGLGWQRDNQILASLPGRQHLRMCGNKTFSKALSWWFTHFIRMSLNFFPLLRVQFMMNKHRLAWCQIGDKSLDKSIITHCICASFGLKVITLKSVIDFHKLSSEPMMIYCWLEPCERIQWNLNQSTKTFILEKAFEMTSAKSRLIHSLTAIMV